MAESMVLDWPRHDPLFMLSVALIVKYLWLFLRKQSIVSLSIEPYNVLRFIVQTLHDW